MSALLRLKVVLVVVALVGVGGVTAAVASGDGGRSKFSTDLVGYEEVPAVSTDGGGTLPGGDLPVGATRSATSSGTAAWRAPSRRRTSTSVRSR